MTVGELSAEQLRASLPPDPDAGDTGSGLAALARELSTLDGFRTRHPQAPASHSQGHYACQYELQTLLAALTGLPEVSVAPLDQDQARLAGLLMLRAYWADRAAPAGPLALAASDRDAWRAVAVRAGFQTVAWDPGMELPPHTAAVIADAEVCSRVAVGDAVPVFIDGASAGPLLPALMPDLCRVDLVSMDCAAQFECPVPAAAGIAASERLAPYLPLPMVDFDGDSYSPGLLGRQKSIGRLSPFDGNHQGIVDALVRLRVLGAEGLARRVTEVMLHRGYVLARLQAAGIDSVGALGAEVVVQPRVPADAVYATLRRQGIGARMLPLGQLALSCPGGATSVEAERSLELVIATMIAID